MSKYLVLILFVSQNLWASDPFNNGFPESQYHKILDEFQTHYGPKIANLGGEFVIWRDWGDGAVNMWAERWGNTYILEIPGGMARYHLIAEEAFVLSICHELGHLIGGEPQQGPISLEGQSDYFAGGQCIREMLDRIEPFAKVVINPDVQDRCSPVPAEDKTRCQRSLQGAKSLTSYYAEILNRPFPQLNSVSSVEVAATLLVHPEPQCRLDTFVAGFFGDPRPRCWFKPSN